MNVFSYSRRMAQGVMVLLLALATVTGLQAQCGDFLTEPDNPPGTAPVAVTLNLPNGGGAVLDAAVLSTYGFAINMGCSYEICQSADFTSSPVTVLPSLFFCPSIATNPNIWYLRVAGANGPSSNTGNVRQLQITVIDNIDPAFSPALPEPPMALLNVNLNTSDDGIVGDCIYTDNGFLNVGTTDNCGGQTVVYYTNYPSLTPAYTSLSGVDFPAGVTTVSAIITDASGNTKFGQFTVTITDDEDPIAGCPVSTALNPIIINADQGACSYTGASGKSPWDFDPTLFFADNCDATAALTYQYRIGLNAGMLGPLTPGNVNGIAFPVTATNHQIRYRATDAAGNTSTCNFFIQVVDNQPATFHSDAAFTLPYTAADNTIGTSTGGATPGLCDGAYTWTHPYLKDNCGVSSATVEFIGATSIAPAGFIQGASTGAVAFNLGTTTVKYTVIDVWGLVSTYDFDITVEDDQAPSNSPALTPIVISAPVVGTTCSKTLPYTRRSVGAVADCGTVTIHETVLPNSPDPDVFVGQPAFDTNTGGGTITVQFPVGTTYIQYCWKDGDGNEVCVVDEVFIDENVNPTALCKPGTITIPVLANGGVRVQPSVVDNMSFDNCAIDTMYIETPNDTLTCNQLGTHTVTLRVVDFAGNSSTCTAKVNIVDNIAPEMTCPANVTVYTATSNCLGDYETTINATDNCEVVDWTYQIGANTFSFANGMLSLANLPLGANSVVLRAYDRVGNSDVCNFTVTVADTVRPTINVTTTPAVANLCNNGVIVRNINTVSCNYIAAPAQPIWTVTGATDNCTASPAISTVGGAPTGTYAQGDWPIVISATDASGNVRTCNFTVRIQETTAPTAVCKDTMVNLSNAPITLFAPTFNGGSTDNCTLGSALTFTLVDTLTNAVLMPNQLVINNNTCGNVSVKLRVTDFNGNPSFCTAKVIVKDNVAPSCVANNITRTLSATNPGSVTVNASEVANAALSTDFCGLSTTNPFQIRLASAPVTSSALSLPFNCGQLGANTVVLRVTDKAGNSSTCTAIVTINDVTPPAVNVVPSNATVDCNTVGASNTNTAGIQAYVNTLVDATFTDNCTATVTSETFTVTAGSCANNYTITRTWTATDGAGLTAQAVQNITVRDITAPTFNVPVTSETIALDANCKAIKSYTVTGISDNCSATNNVTFTWTIDHDGTLPVDYSGTGTTATPGANGFFFNAGQTTSVSTIIFTATDACGNTATKSIQVTVTDNAAPSTADYNQPASINSYCGAVLPLTPVNLTNSCTYSFSWYRPYSGPAIGAPFNISPDFTDCSNITVTETITAQTPTGQQNIVASIPYNQNDALNAFSPYSITVPVGTTTINYKITDVNGNMNTCSIRVVVNDVTAPTLTCPPTVTLNSICPTAVVPNYLNLVNVSDNCNNNVVVSQSKMGAQLGNLATIQYLPTPGVPAADPADGSEFEIVFTATDGTNNATPCVTKVVLDDIQSPLPDVEPLADLVWDCGFAYVNAPTAKTNDCGMGSGATIYGTPGGVSAIGIETLTGNPGVVTKYKITSPPGTYFITWAYNDGNGNVSTQSQKLVINPDVKKPIPVCETVTTQIVLNANGTASITPEMIDNGSYDQSNCGPYPYVDSVKLSLSQTIFTCADLSKTSVILHVTDFGGNDTTCTAPIKVIDNIAPVINMATVPANDTIEVCAIGFVPPVAPTVTATDNCSVSVSLSQVSTQGTAGPSKYNYTIVRTWTATDAGGNTATKSQVLTIVDNVAPVLATLPPSAFVFNTAAVTANCSATVKFNVANYVSDCAPDNELSFVITPAYFSLTDSTEVLPVGTHTVNFKVTDPAGNSSVSTLIFVVKDATKPTASCINGISVALDANGQAIVTPNLINNQSTDNCNALAPITLLIQELDEINGDTIADPSTELIFGCNDADGDTQYPIVLWVYDDAGNFNFCETSVVIQDNVAPTVTCPANKTVSCSTTPATAFSTTVLGNATAVDNCNNNVVNNITYPVITYTDAPVNNGYTCNSFVRTFKATDLAGNIGTCSQSITVTDTKPPVFDAPLPQNDTIACGTFAADTILTAKDNCTPTDSIKIVFSQVITPANNTLCGTKYNYTTVRTWTATDKCGNSSTHSQVLVVRDTVAPLFIGPKTITVQSANFPPTTNCTVFAAVQGDQWYTDCAPLSDFTIKQVTFDTIPAGLTTSGLNASGQYPVGQTLVYFSVADACGNARKDTVVVNVIDNSAPVVVCNNNVEIALTNNGQATLTANEIDLNSYDNCGIASRILSKTQFDCADLGVNVVTLTVTDVYGNSNTCEASVEVTANAATGFQLDSLVVAPTYFGGNDGKATAIATGGSNTFNYLWNTGATTATLNNLVAGTYTVAVSDQFSGCQQVINVIVPDGPKVQFTVGTATGAQNTIVKVPVYANNFSEISGFTFTLNIPNAAVGAPTTPVLANINPALGNGLNASVSGNVVSVLYLNTGANNVTLPANSLLFNICIQLSNAALGTSSPVNIENAPVQFQVIRGTTVIPTEPSVNGSVQITAGLNAYDILGDIKPWQNPNTGVPNADVTVSGPIPAQAPVLTTTTGIYQFVDINANTNTVTEVEKIQSGNTKIDIIDQGLLLKHIFANATNPSPLTSAYQRVAADVNFDGQINIIDFALIQRLLLGTVQNLEGANAKDWVFIPASYVFPASATTPFPNPTYPLLPVFPQSITHTPLFQDELNDDFIGVRMGDLNGDAPLNLQGGGASADRDGANLIMRVQDKALQNGETTKVAFTAKDFDQQNGFQFTLGFDPNALELVDIETTLDGLDAAGNFGTAQLGEGLLSAAWNSLDAVTVADDATLFILSFKAKTAVNALSQALHLNGQIVEPMNVAANGSVGQVQLDFVGAVSNANQVADQAFVLYQNQPNPFVAQTTIGFRLPAAERCALRIYDANSRLVKTVVGDYEQGFNTIILKTSDLGGAGVFYYELSTPSFSDRKKMVVIR